MYQQQVGFICCSPDIENRALRAVNIIIDAADGSPIIFDSKWLNEPAGIDVVAANGLYGVLTDIFNTVNCLP